jgi:retron-type reverse transcriptase
MTKEAIVTAASKMESIQDLLVLLNRVKIDSLGDRGHLFTLKQLNFFINPKRNRDCYRSFTIPKKSGGVRTISAPVKMLKSFQTYTNVILQAFYDAPDSVTGFVPEKSIVDNAGKHVGMNYVFNTDIKDFFPSISKSRVWATLKAAPFNFNDTIADAIAGLCCTYVNLDENENNIALPQGSPCSPILTNIVCRNLDRRLGGLAKKLGLNYSRYADDITFSSMHNVYQDGGDFLTELHSIVEGQRFILNEKKTRLQKKGARQEVTGLVVNERVNVSREYLRDLENLLFIWEKYGRASAFGKFVSRHSPKHNLRSSEFDMERVIGGRLAYVRMVKGETNPVWRKLQKRYNKLVGRPESHLGTDIQYLSYYSISKFRTLTGIQPVFSNEDGKLSVFIDINGAKNKVSLSKSAREHLKSVFESDSKENALESFISKHIITYCHSTDYFWMITRGVPKKSLNTKGAEEEDSFSPVTAVGTLFLKSTDEILNELIQNNFDLKTLDQWDKIRKS